MSQRARGVVGVGGGRLGVFRLDQYTSMNGAGTFFRKPSQTEFLEPGTYTWVCPAGVFSVSAVCVGGGGGGYQTWSNAAGGGGGLGWKNNIPVVPGQSYTVYVGQGGGRQGSGIGWAGQTSYFISLATVAGYGGGNATAGAYTNGANQNGSGGGWVGDGGGAGGSASYQGGGGAGGYAGNGGASSSDAPAGGGGAGGGYYSSTYGTGAGGGVGIYGQRTDYTAATNRMYGSNGGATRGTNQDRGSALSGLGGQGGSTRTGIVSGVLTGWGGMNGENTTYGYNSNAIHGGFPGGGGGGSGTSAGGGNGANGAVRIIWGGERAGEERAFPTTNTEDLT